MFGVGMDVATPVISPAFSLRPAARGPAPVLLLVLTLAWLPGAVIVGARWLRGWWAAECITRAARPAPGVPADVRVTEADIEPAVARVFRPVVLLPAALLGRLAPQELEALIEHERAHVARHDNFF